MSELEQAKREFKLHLARQVLRPTKKVARYRAYLLKKSRVRSSNRTETAKVGIELLHNAEALNKQRAILLRVLKKRRAQLARKEGVARKAARHSDRLAHVKTVQIAALNKQRVRLLSVLRNKPEVIPQKALPRDPVKVNELLHNARIALATAERGDNFVLMKALKRTVASLEDEFVRGVSK